MKYCQGLKQNDRLYDKLMEMEPKSWATTHEIIKRHAQNMALKADLVEATSKNQGHVVMAMSWGNGNPTPRPRLQIWCLTLEQKPHVRRGGEEIRESTVCYLKHEPAGEEESQLSIL